MQVLFNDLRPQWDAIKKAVMPELNDLLSNGPYISGRYVLEFEKKFASLCKTSYAVGVSNATDGLKLVIQALEYPKHVPVMVPANGYISDALAPSYFGHPIIPIDCDDYYNMSVIDLEKRVNQYPEAIVIPVHFYGQPCNMLRIAETVSSKTAIIGDCSHAHGATINDIPIGSFGIASVFSLYPTKNLGAMGDAGIIVTNNEKLYNKLKILRDYGSQDHIDYQHMGWNNRLDEIQALILCHKLPYLERWNLRRKEIALQYSGGLHHLDEFGFIRTPKRAPYADGNVYHLYTIRTQKRDQLREYLTKHGIQTLIRYPLPIHKMQVFKELEKNQCPRAELFALEVLSLPMHPFLTKNEIECVVSSIKDFFEC